jgi:hypothetical protein
MPTITTPAASHVPKASVRMVFSKALGPPLFEYHLSALEPHFLGNHCKGAIRSDRRSSRADVAREENGRAGVACFVHQGAHCFQHLSQRHGFSGP